MTHGRQRPKQNLKQRRAVYQHKRLPLDGQTCDATGKKCWTRDTARSQARFMRKRDGADTIGWYRCSHCAWFHLGHE